MEEEPRVLEFRGEELARVSHAYGTNGIITEVEMPLAPAYDWVEMFVAFEDFEPAVDFAEGLANEGGILIKLATVFEAPIAHDYFQRVKPHVQPGTHMIGLMVAGLFSIPLPWHARARRTCVAAGLGMFFAMTAVY